MRIMHAFLISAALIAGPVALSPAAAAEPTVIANGEFEPPADLKSFKAMTFVLDFAPGTEVPLHSHGGRSLALMLQGEITLKKLDGTEVVYKAGDSWVEEVGGIHSARSTGDETARAVWTILLPEGAALDTAYKQ